MRPARSVLRIAAKAAALLACAVLLVRALSGADWAGSLDRLEVLGPAAVLVLLPFPLGMALDAAAWKSLLARTGHSISLPRLFRVRMATEAVTIALPAGGLLTEALGPALLADQAPVSASFASSAAKRWLIIRTHGYYVLLGVALGSSLLGRHAVWIALGSAVALVALSIAIQAAAMRLGLSARVHDALAKLRASRLFRRLAAVAAVGGDRTSFERADRSLRELGARWHVGPSLALLGMWLLESLEAFLILRLLGAPVAYVDVLAIEAALSVVRSAALFAPAGLGVQDLGYLALFGLLGIPDLAAVGPAFLIVKRTKEAVFVTLGLVLLLVSTRRPDAEARTDATGYRAVRP